MAIQDSDIADQYQRVLGRAPTRSELDQFKQFANNGDIPLTAQDIGEIIGGLPEAQKKSLDQYGGDLENRLAGSDQRILDLAGKTLNQNFTGLRGAGNDSSAYVNAFASAARDLALSRQQQLAGYYGQGYNNLLGRSKQLSDATRQSGINSINSQNQWNRELDMWNRQHDYLEDQRNRSSRQGRIGAITGLALGAAGAGVGGAFGGVKGAQLGGSLGGSFGQGFGSFF